MKAVVYESAATSAASKTDRARPARKLLRTKRSAQFERMW